MLITLVLAGALDSAACLGCGPGTYSTADGTILLSLEFGLTAESVGSMGAGATSNGTCSQCAAGSFSAGSGELHASRCSNGNGLM
jgi:hypothetical protein